MVAPVRDTISHISSVQYRRRINSSGSQIRFAAFVAIVVISHVPQVKIGWLPSRQKEIANIGLISFLTIQM
jgi:hypothetical protein